MVTERKNDFPKSSNMSLNKRSCYLLLHAEQINYSEGILIIFQDKSFLSENELE